MSRGYGPRRGYPRGPEKHRWLRSDGTPNFSDRIYKKTEELELLAKRPVETVASSTPILEALEKMSRGYRSLLVTKGQGYLEGLIVAMDLINYLGGGDYYNIVVNRHGKNIYSAIRNEPVETIMTRDPIVAYIDEKFPAVLEKMVVHGVGVLPIITRDNRIYGILTEKDILDYLSATSFIGVKVSSVMSSPVITVSEKDSLKRAMETMIKYGFRRLPVVINNIVRGILTAMDIIKFFGKHEAFKYTVSGSIEDVLKVPVSELMVRNVVTVSLDSDVGEAARIMSEKGVGSVLVVSENYELIGIVSERDVLYAIASSSS